jgi:hypothetical protein
MEIVTERVASERKWKWVKKNSRKRKATWKEEGSSL